MWLALTAAAISLQWRAGAFEGDFGGHPDEGAHFVTGLMVRDYLVSGIPQHPMRFAEDYYVHYPKVALGHYPPGFYAVEGLWLSVFPVSRGSVLMLMAVLCGTFGTIVFAFANSWARSVPVSLAIAGAAVALPLTQTMTSTVMSDLLVAILVLLAARSFIRFLEGENWRDSLLFGLFAAGATMTKASGLFLALLPPLAILLTWRYRVLRKWSLWVSVLPVALICGPWLAFSSKITAEGLIERGVLEHVQIAVPYFGSQFVRVFGWALLVPAALGWVRILRQRALRCEPLRAVVFALPVCLIAFYSAIPAGLEPRYLLPAVPPVLLLAAMGIEWVAAKIPDQRRRVACWGIGTVVIGLFLVETFSVPKKEFAGYRLRVRELFDLVEQSGESSKFLISSDARGEGAFISEVAILDARRPSHKVERSSKVLSKSDWLGRGYQEAFGSDEQLLSFLVEASYDGIFVDEAIPEIFLRPHHTRVARVLESSDAFTRVPERPGRPVRPGPRGGRNAVYLRAADRP